MLIAAKSSDVANCVPLMRRSGSRAQVPRSGTACVPSVLFLGEIPCPSVVTFFQVNQGPLNLHCAGEFGDSADLVLGAPALELPYYLFRGTRVPKA